MKKVMACHLHVICMSSACHLGGSRGRCQVRTDFERTSNGLRTDFERTSNGLRTDFERTSNGLRTDFERLRSTRIPHTLMESTGAPVASYTNLGAEWQPVLPRYFQQDVLMPCCLLSTFKIANVKKQKPSERKLKEYPIKMFQVAYSRAPHRAL